MRGGEHMVTMYSMVGMIWYAILEITHIPSGLAGWQAGVHIPRRYYTIMSDLQKPISNDGKDEHNVGRSGNPQLMT